MSIQANMRTGRMLVLAITGAAGAVMPAMVLGQYQTVNSSGRLLDANNRLGSAGLNDERQTAGGVSADDIIYGNVTRGRQFRGTVNEPDSRAFRGNLERPSDELTRDAGPSVYQRGAAVDPFVAQRYYGDNRGVRPPEGFGQLVPGSPGTFQVAKPTSRAPGDLRMDETIPNPDISLSQPIQYITPGISLLSEDPNSVRGMTATQQMEQELMPSRDLLRRLNLDETRVREMRDELRRNADREEGTEQAPPARPDDLTRAAEAPISDPLDSSVRNDMAAQTVSGAVNTQQSLRHELVTATPSAARQSTQYAELQKRLERFRQRSEMTDQEANQKFLKEWRAAQEAERQEQQTQQHADAAPLPPQNVQPQGKQTLPDANEQGDAAEGATLRQRYASRAQQPDAASEGVLPPQPEIPLRIASFAEGVKATGLKNLLTDAERAMRAGKFTQALDYYDGAAAVAPNNPLILVGRSIAELGAGYYARAQVHLEEVLSTDPALLMARYDLKAFYGEDRLQYIVRDLKDVAQTESKQSRPLFLLAFIAYSTENEQRAADYLNLAEQRGGSKGFYDKLREYWKLPAEGAKTAAAGPATAPAPVGAAAENK